MAQVKVPFYGHERQYHSIKAELDAAINGVLESGAYVLGPALKKFEGEFAKYMRSVVERGQVKLPLAAQSTPENDALKGALADKPVLVSFDGNKKEYLGA